MFQKKIEPFNAAPITLKLSNNDNFRQDSWIHMPLFLFHTHCGENIQNNKAFGLKSTRVYDECRVLYQIIKIVTY
jgi:hypothetical protein